MSPRPHSVTDGMALLAIDGVRDLAEDVFDENGRMKVMPAAYYEQTTIEERGLFGNRYGIYSFPTEELVDFLQKQIGDRKAIEIGAGHGVLAEALGIPATDNYQQEMPEYREFYDKIGQTIVPYGPNVEKIDARRWSLAVG